MIEQPVIAIVDDEKDVRESISQWLALSGYSLRTYAGAEQALRDINADFPGIIVSDFRMPGLDGIEFLRRLKAIDSQLPVIMITGHGDIPLAVTAMKSGAYDILEKPFEPDRLTELSRRAVEARCLILENRTLKRELSDGTVLSRKLVGTSQAMQHIREEILDASQADRHVMIRGEIGTGKSTIARALHACGPRQGKKIVTVNCDAFADDELSRQLFGPLDSGQPLLDQSLGGSLCLEAIHALPPGLQARLLERIETMENRDGSLLRIISVFNQDPDDGTGSAEAVIRRDLLDRLTAFQIFLPPLRQRGEDILTLFTHFTWLFSEEYGYSPPAVTANDAAHLIQADWPGNIRQVIQVAERAVLSNRRGGYSLGTLLSTGSGDPQVETETADNGLSLRDNVDAFERMLIDHSMRRHSGSIDGVTDDLSVPRRALNEKLAKFGMNRADYLK
ncbi:MAG: sigma-54 dependent transcriptional regulator [Paracoccaceae bacterium]|nr:sigma-54 dependent transcriptional regulator [Paracoccaceae bacterium]